jgi:hypothetical protein
MTPGKNSGRLKRGGARALPLPSSWLLPSGEAADADLHDRPELRPKLSGGDQGTLAGPALRE